MLEELKNKIALEEERWKDRLANEKKQIENVRQRLLEKQSFKKNTKNITDASFAAASAFTEVSLSDYQFWVVIFSILADVFTLFPIIGNLMAVIFAILFWIIYFFNGHFKQDRWAAKMGIKIIADLLEIFGLGINFLPFFTASALMNYWITLTERKMEKEEKGS